MKYKKDFDYSYAFGAFPTMELVNNKPETIRRILVHGELIETKEVQEALQLIQSKGIKLQQNTKLIRQIADKENIYIIGEFNKYISEFDDGNIVVLVNPSDMGNVGTILRTSLGFGIKNIVLIQPHADVFNPKTIRASMGSIFSLNIKSFKTFEDFYNQYNNYSYYMFALGSETTLQTLKRDKKEKFALVFGNEATGLPENILNYGKRVFIRHNDAIDSLNLSISASIALYEFSK